MSLTWPLGVQSEQVWTVLACSDSFEREGREGRVEEVALDDVCKLWVVYIVYLAVLVRLSRRWKTETYLVLISGAIAHFFN